MTGALTTSVPLRHQAGDEPLPGYRLLAPLGQGGFGEVWKCQVPGGLYKAIKFVHGNLDEFDDDSGLAEQELAALEHIKDIRHPFLLSMERVEVVGGELMIVMELADKSLSDLYEERRQAGLAGIPRDELLGYLLEAAEVLDLMRAEHGLQHLDIKPANLFLISNHVKVADFGLVNSLGERSVEKNHEAEEEERPAALRESGGQAPAGSTPRYASPEILQGRMSRHSDQYSLAVVYQELLTGSLPFAAKSFPQLLIIRLTQPPQLAALSEADRPLLAKALAPEPEERFGSCTEFIQALLAVAEPGAAPSRPPVGMRQTRAASVRPTCTRETKAEIMSNPPDTKTEIVPLGDLLAAAERVRATPGVPPLPPFKFLAQIGRGPLGEVWKAVGPDGRDCLLQFLPSGGLGPERQQRLVTLLQEIEHPAVPGVELYRSDSGQVVLATEPFDQTLHERLQEYRAQGQPSVPRRELIDYLRTAADALDVLAKKHGLHHLGLNPRNLQLWCGRLLLRDFGLVQLLGLDDGRAVLQANGRYAAPELAQRRVTRATDQFSLALIYAELLTGVHPCRKGSPYEVSQRRGRGQLDLELVPRQDRDVLRQALHADPAQRYASCREMVNALAEAQKSGTRPAVSFYDELPRVLVPPGASKRRGSPPAQTDVVRALIAHAAEGSQVFTHQSFRYVVDAASELEHRCGVQVAGDELSRRLDAFRKEWGADVLRRVGNTIVYFVPARRSLGQLVFGARPGLEVRVEVQDQPQVGASFAETKVHAKPAAGSGKRGGRLLTEMSPVLLESLRTYLQAIPEQRTDERWAYEADLKLYPTSPALPNQELTERIEARGKDVSPGGFAFYVRQPLTAEYVYLLHEANPPLGPAAILARILRTELTAAGTYEVAAAFVLDE